MDSNKIAYFVEMGKKIISVMQKKLYLVVIAPAIYVTYKVLEAVTKKDHSGKSIFNSIIGTIDHVTKEVQELSDECPQLIGEFGKFLDCIGF
jgi:hypothetical protein